MKRAFRVLLALGLALYLCCPSFAIEPEGKYLYTLWFEKEFDPDKEYEMGRERPDLYHMDETAPAPPGPGYEQREPTPEEKQQREAYWKEQNDDFKDERNIMMKGVFGDPLNDRDEDHEVPDDAWEGGYRDFKGKDGSTTRVYDNGGIVTTYRDGTKEGYDYKNNRWTKDKNGNDTVHFSDGYSASSSGDDGSFDLRRPDGDVYHIREDGTYTWTNTSGVTIDYNEDGERTAIGFIGGEKLPLENGMFPQGDGSIKGPNGAELNWHNGCTQDGDFGYGFDVRGTDGATGKATYTSMLDGKVFVDKEATEKARQQTNGKAEAVTTTYTRFVLSGMDGGVQIVTIDNYDREKYTIEHESPEGDVFTEKYLGDGMFEKHFISADGSYRSDFAVNDNGINGSYRDETGEHKVVETSVDENGNAVIRWEGGATMTATEDGMSKLDLGDGKTITVDPDTGTRTYRDAATGERCTVDEDGNVLDFDMKLGGGYRIAGNDGAGYTITDKDGETTTVTRYSDGSMSAVMPDGSTLTKEPGGEWLKDGKELPQEPDLPEDKSAIAPDDIVGTWDVTVTFSNIDSPLVGILKGVFDDMFGEGSGDEIVNENRNDTVTGQQVVTIETLEGNRMRATVNADGDVMVYEGKLGKGGKLALKLVSQSGDEDEISIPIDKITYTFVRRGDAIVIDGACRIDTFWLKADMYNSGTMR